MNEMPLTNGKEPGHEQNGNGSRSNGLGSVSVNGNGRATTQPTALTSLLLSLARELIAVDDDAASELPLRQLRVCALLHEQPQTMSALGRELGVSLSAMTQIADRLERAGLVKRSAEGTDRRVRSLQLTPRGQRIMMARENARIGRASGALNRLSATDQAQVIHSLETLLNACHSAKPKRKV
jgi:DNA-binding MarR family transcriptional regulator